MARYVVLYFEENEQAEQFCDGTSAFNIEGDTVALVPAPTLFCECGITGKKTTAGWFKGKKYGWWVCALCGKPSEAWGSSYAAVISAGVNLLSDEQTVVRPGYDQER